MSALNVAITTCLVVLNLMPQVRDAKGITARRVGATLPPVMSRVVEGGLSPVG